MYIYICIYLIFFAKIELLRVDVFFIPRGKTSSYILQFSSWGQLCKGHLPCVSEATIISCQACSHVQRRLRTRVCVNFQLS